MALYVVEKKEIHTRRIVVEAHSVDDALEQARVSDDEGEVEYERTLSSRDWNVLLNGEYVY